MSALGDTLGLLARVLDGAQLRWFVFGAQAVAVRGAPRATQDIDVTADIPRPRLQAVLAALEAEGLKHRYPDIADEILATGSVIPLRHPSGMEVDLVLAGAGLEMLALSRATRVSVDGVSVPVAHATDLVVMVGEGIVPRFGHPTLPRSSRAAYAPRRICGAARCPLSSRRSFCVGFA